MPGAGRVDQIEARGEFAMPPGSKGRQFRPDCFQIGIFGGHFEEALSADHLARLAEPEPGFVKASEPAGVAGKVVRDRPLLMEAFGDAAEFTIGLVGAPQFMEREGLVNPRGGRAGLDGNVPAGDVECRFPCGRMGAHVPAEIEHLGMFPIGGTEARQFGFRFGGAPEIQPAGGGVQVVAVRKIECGHARD